MVISFKIKISDYADEIKTDYVDENKIRVIFF